MCWSGSGRAATWSRRRARAWSVSTRLLGFVQQSGNAQVTQESRVRYRTLSRDVLAMTDHSNFLGNKVSFLLDATLGMVSIDQNNVVKIFSVVTVFLLPPSVIVGFFGMNFERMPWIHETWGVWASAAVVVVSAVVPFIYFQAPPLAVAAFRASTNAAELLFAGRWSLRRAAACWPFPRRRERRRPAGAG